MDRLRGSPGVGVGHDGPSDAAVLRPVLGSRRGVVIACGMNPRYGSRNPFPWLGETIDLGKEKNFFETRVTEYQSGGALTW